MKQETLEEAIIRLTLDEEDVSKRLAGAYYVTKGAKWQEERSYSEEEVISLLDKFGDHIDEWYSNGFNTETEITEKWFEQFKKK